MGESNRASRARSGGRSVRGLARALERGRRTFLRYPLKGDAREFGERLRASADLHRPWNPAPADGSDPCGPQVFERFLATARSEDASRTLLCRRSDGAIVGWFNCSVIVRGAFQSAFLGYAAFVPFAGKGYMREGLELVLRHAFGRLELHRLEANIIPRNAASVALVRGAGFRREGFSPNYLEIAGRWEGHERWAITVEDREG